MNPNVQIIIGYILTALCAIGALASGIMVKNGYDRKREQPIVSQPVAPQAVLESQSLEKENKQKIAKIQINRITEDVAPWLDDKIEQNKAETNKITNDFNMRGAFHSGSHISMQIKRVNGFIKLVNDYIKETNRKIEDILLGVKEEKFESVSWLKEEYKKYTAFIERAKTVENNIKQQNNELCLRITDKATFENIQKSLPYAE
ncbi:MAG: hypothetical protein Q8N14_03250 [Candidatus Omnitrophota bacterium]|nr:hypothetical protein [Candidatus Omnitrophota bacterium]